MVAAVVAEENFEEKINGKDNLEVVVFIVNCVTCGKKWRSASAIARSVYVTLFYHSAIRQHVKPPTDVSVESAWCDDEVHHTADISAHTLSIL